MYPIIILISKTIRKIDIIIYVHHYITNMHRPKIIRDD